MKQLVESLLHVSDSIRNEYLAFVFVFNYRRIEHLSYYLFCAYSHFLNSGTASYSHRIYYTHQLPSATIPAEHSFTDSNSVVRSGCWFINNTIAILIFWNWRQDGGYCWIVLIVWLCSLRLHLKTMIGFFSSSFPQNVNIFFGFWFSSFVSTLATWLYLLALSYILPHILSSILRIFHLTFTMLWGTCLK